MIKLEHLYKTYHLKNKTVEALKDVSLTINDGEIYGIIGYSGAGKSSLIRCINLLEKPDSGSIQINDVTLTSLVEIKKKGANVVHQTYLKEKKLREIRKGVGMIFQHFNLLDRSTVFENVAYPLRHSKLTKDELTKRVFELLDLVDLSDKINAYPSQLSGGQKQRVAIARALANNPSVLLSDEATSALDPEATQSILALLKKLNEQLGLTIVLITHEMAVIKAICSKVSVMDAGEIVEEGNVYEVFANPREEVTRKFVDTTSTLTKINTMMAEKSELIELGESGKLVKLIYQKSSVGDALISSVSRLFNVDVSIVLANVEILQNAPLGGMIALFKGEAKNIESALEFFQKNEVKVEVLDHGRVH